MHACKAAGHVHSHADKCQCRFQPDGGVHQTMPYVIAASVVQHALVQVTASQNHTAGKPVLLPL